VFFGGFFWLIGLFEGWPVFLVEGGSSLRGGGGRRGFFFGFFFSGFGLLSRFPGGGWDGFFRKVRGRGGVWKGRFLEGEEWMVLSLWKGGVRAGVFLWRSSCLSEGLTFRMYKGGRFGGLDRVFLGFLVERR